MADLSSGFISSREQWEREKQAIADAMMPFVKEHKSIWFMKSQYETISLIVDGCRRLKRDGDVWVPEFLPGTDISDACRVAWAVHCHTGMSVRFRFNDVEISMTGKEKEAA